MAERMISVRQRSRKEKSEHAAARWGHRLSEGSRRTPDEETLIDDDDAPQESVPPLGRLVHQVFARADPVPSVPGTVCCRQTRQHVFPDNVGVVREFEDGRDPHEEHVGNRRAGRLRDDLFARDGVDERRASRDRSEHEEHADLEESGGDDEGE